MNREIRAEASVAMVLGLMLATATLPGAEAKSPIPFDQISAVAGKQYSGEGLAVTATAEGARLRCVFQRLNGEATSEGLWLTSTTDEALGDRFRVTAQSVGRMSDEAPPGFGMRQSSGAFPSGANVPKRQRTAAVQDAVALPQAGSVTVAGQTVRFTRLGLVEEYSVSLDGVRQDFVVLEKPGSSGRESAPSETGEKLEPTDIGGYEGAGELRLDLEVTGARVEVVPNGARLVLDGSGRKIAYSPLKVTDANGKELPARMEVASGILPDVEGAHPAARNEALNCGEPGGAGSPLPAVAGEGHADGAHGVTRPTLLAGVISAGLEAAALRQAGMPAATLLAILVNDTDAAYPIRIDPTFSDENWVSMNPSIPGAIF